MQAATQALRLSLVSYTASDDSSTQTLFDCTSFGVATGSCASTSSSALTVAVPDCGFQIDLIYGTPLQSINQDDYHHLSHVWISGQLGDVRSETTCSAASTPTPTPTSRTGPTPDPVGSGVLGISTPSTGSATGSTLQTALGALLLATGAGAVTYADRRLRTGTPIPTP